MAIRSFRAQFRFVLIGCVALVLTAFAPGAFASSPQTPIHLEKTCGGPLNGNDVFRCTITDSDSFLVPEGAWLLYTGVPLDGSGWELNSGFAMTTSSGTAAGHCTFSWAKLIGTCMFVPGTGSLSTFRATLQETLTGFESDPLTISFELNGAYRTW